MVVLKFIAPNVIELNFYSDEPARFSGLLRRPIQPGNFTLSLGKERLTPRHIPRESSISRNVPISTWIIARVRNRRDFPIARVLRLVILKHRV